MRHSVLGGTLIAVVISVVGIVLFLLAFYALTLRFGPGRGNFNQPAAALREPGTRVVRTLYVVAALHVLMGAIVWLAAPGFNGLVWGALLIGIAMGGFFLACAWVMKIADAAPRSFTRISGRAAP